MQKPLQKPLQQPLQQPLHHHEGGGMILMHDPSVHAEFEGKCLNFDFFNCDLLVAKKGQSALTNGGPAKMASGHFYTQREWAKWLSQGWH